MDTYFFQLLLLHLPSIMCFILCGFWFFRTKGQENLMLVQGLPLLLIFIGFAVYFRFWLWDEISAPGMGSVVSFMVFLPTIVLATIYGVIVGISGLYRRTKGEDKGLLTTSLLSLSYMTPLVVVTIYLIPLISLVILLKKAYKRMSHAWRLKIR